MLSPDAAHKSFDDEETLGFKQLYTLGGKRGSYLNSNMEMKSKKSFKNYDHHTL